MALSNDDIQEIRELIIETIREETDSVEAIQEISEFAEGDQVPVLRSSQGVNTYGRADVSLFGGGGGGSVVIVNDLTTGGTTKALSAEMGKTLKGMVDAVSMDVKVNMSVSQTVIYKGASTNVTVSASTSGITPDTLKIKEGDTEIASTTNNASVSTQRTINTTDNSKTYTSIASYKGLNFNGTITLYARYPIYCGMGADASAVAVTGNKIDPTTTAARTYSKTASANGQYFFLLVPSDISDVNTFTMGGAPFAMNSVTTTTIGGVTYKVHKSSYAYNSGTILNVKAE